MSDVRQLIQDFYRVAQSRGFSRDIHFRLLSINAGGASTVSFNQDDLVYVKAAALPGRNIKNVAVPYMGLNFNIPGTAEYPGSDSYELKFFCDAESAIRQTFEKWSRDIFDDTTSTGNYFTPTQASTIDLIQLDAQMNKVAQYQLVGCSVRSVGPLAYNMQGTGETVEFTATVAFHYWTRKSP